jgi:hypothetical protein
MSVVKERTRTFTHTCIVCNHIWISGSAEPVSCAKCKSKRWNYDEGHNTGHGIEFHIPVPIFDHSEKKELKYTGSRCPYCSGTTGIDSQRVVAFCYSCDFTWSLFGQPLGVVMGIGVQ